ncbi:S24 family peptidase [Acinetobacter nosocomialis]|uniref:S24 family peptidase n=1 Tax=Acinetobacter nosocomialis TaxID=106654 RepID=UPI00396F45E7
MDKKGYPMRGRAGVLSKEFKISDKGASKWLKGESIPETAKIPLLAKFVGVPAEWLLTGKEPAKFKQFDVDAFRKQHNVVDDDEAVRFIEVPVQPFPLQKRYVPVKAYSKMGMDGYFTDMGYEGNGGDGYIPTHTAGAKAYGVKGTGDSMFPAIRNGWYVVCDPDAELVPTEFVQVCLKDGRCTIKEFVGINGGVLSLLAVNGGERLSFDMDEVESITAITDIVPPSQHRQEHPYSH